MARDGPACSWPAARRAGLEFVEKFLTDSVVALLDRAESVIQPAASLATMMQKGCPAGSA
jgi:hypothetical protein